MYVVPMSDLFRRSRMEFESEAKPKVAFSSGSNDNQKSVSECTGPEQSVSPPTVSSEVVECTPKSELLPAVESREEGPTSASASASTHPTSGEFRSPSASASQFLDTDTRPLPAPLRNDSGGQPIAIAIASPASGKHEYKMRNKTTNAQRNLMNVPGRPAGTAHKYPFLAKRIKRFAAEEMHISAKKTSLPRNSPPKAEKQESGVVRICNAKQIPPSDAPLESSETLERTTKTFSEAAIALVNGTERLAARDTETSSINLNSLFAVGRWVKGVLLHRLPISGDIAQQLESFKMMRSVSLNKSKQSGCRPLEHKHKPMTAASPHSRDKNLHGTNSIASRQIRKQAGVSCANGAAQFTSSVSYPLLPGATALTGGQFMTPQDIFDLLSDSTVRERAVGTIPAGPKTNCFFVVNIGAELTDYKSYESGEIRRKIYERLRDGTVLWNRQKTDNSKCYSISDSGILKCVSSMFDLRMHTAKFCESVPVRGEQPAKRTICWFFNAERSPAPGFVVVSYLGTAHEHSFKAPISNSTVNSNATRKRERLSEAEDNDVSDEFIPPATKHNR